MHPNNNNNGAQAVNHANGKATEANADERRARDPLFRKLASSEGRSEAMNAVMDELSGTATSRRADAYNSVKH